MRATVYRPDIGGLLPLYVADRYEGFDARPFNELSDGRGRALRGGERRRRARGRRSARGSDVALANHLVMGPAILARALGRRPVRGQDPRQRAGVHRQAVPALQARSPSRASRARAACSSAPATPPRACGRRWTTRRCPAAPASARRASTWPASPRATPEAAQQGLRALRDAPARRSGRRCGARHGAPRRPPARRSAAPPPPPPAGAAAAASAAARCRRPPARRRRRPPRRGPPPTPAAATPPTPRVARLLVRPRRRARPSPRSTPSSPATGWSCSSAS